MVDAGWHVQVQVGAGPISDRHLLLCWRVLASLIMSRGKKEKVTSGLPCVSTCDLTVLAALHTNLSKRPMMAPK